MTKQILTGLSAKAYEHPFDRQALSALQKMPGMSPLLKKVNEFGIDRLLRLQSYGSDIKVTFRNFPQLHQSLEETCKILDVEPFPQLYLSRGMGYIHTYTIGVENPIIGISSEGIKYLNTDELIYTFGYEVSRIKGQHMIYHQMALVMPTLKNLVSSTTLGLGNLLASGLELALYNWAMMAKFTADRAGLLACQDINVAIATLLKFSGLQQEYITDIVIEDFLIQARDFATNNFSNLDKITKVLSYSELRLSWMIMRAGELLKWYESGEYERLIQQQDYRSSPGDQNEDIASDVSDTAAGDWNFLSSW